MNFSIEKSILLYSLQQLSKALPPRSTLPILSSVLLEVDDNRLEMRTTDLEITITVRLDVDAVNPGKITIPLHKLLEITNEMPEGSMEFEISDIGKVIIKSSFGQYTIMGESAENFPAKPAIINPKEIALPSNTLTKIIEQTTYAVSREEIKPALQGVYFQLGENNLRTVATDGHRLIRYTIDGVAPEGFRGDVIIPAKFLSIVRTHLSPDSDIQLMIDENHVKITLGDTTISSRIIDQKYPDYENVIPTDNDKKILINKNKLLSSVKRVSIFSNKSTRQISLAINNNQLTISTEDPENITTGKEVHDCSYDGEPMTISYNAAYLKEVLNHQNSENVLIKLKTPVSAGIFIPEDGEEDIITLLMPIR